MVQTARARAEDSSDYGGDEEHQAKECRGVGEPGDSCAVRISAITGGWSPCHEHSQWSHVVTSSRRHVVAVARRGGAPIRRVAKGFDISESCLQRWLKTADVKDGVEPGVTQADATERREATEPTRLLK